MQSEQETGGLQSVEADSAAFRAATTPNSIWANCITFMVSAICSAVFMMPKHAFAYEYIPTQQDRSEIRACVRSADADTRAIDCILPTAARVVSEFMDPTLPHANTGSVAQLRLMFQSAGIMCGAPSELDGPTPPEIKPCLGIEAKKISLAIASSLKVALNEDEKNTRLSGELNTLQGSSATFGNWRTNSGLSLAGEKYCSLSGSSANGGNGEISLVSTMSGTVVWTLRPANGTLPLIRTINSLAQIGTSAASPIGYEVFQLGAPKGERAADWLLRRAETSDTTDKFAALVPPQSMFRFDFPNTDLSSVLISGNGFRTALVRFDVCVAEHNSTENGRTDSARAISADKDPEYWSEFADMIFAANKLCGASISSLTQVGLPVVMVPEDIASSAEVTCKFARQN